MPNTVTTPTTADLVYYTGDMANACGWFRIVRADGGAFDLEELPPGDGRTFRGVRAAQVGTEYHGHCGTRFVTEDAYHAWRSRHLAPVSDPSGDAEAANAVAASPDRPYEATDDRKEKVMATTAKSRKDKAPDAASGDVPPVEDVTGSAPEPAPDLAAVAAEMQDALLGAVKSAIKIETVQKPAYVRVMHDGQAVAYVRKGRKGLGVQVEYRATDPAQVQAIVDAIVVAAGGTK